MSRVRSLLGLVLLVVALAAPASAQDVKLRSHLSSGVVKLGGQVTLAVTVENARDASIVELPKVEGLSIGRLQGPSIRTMESWINGRRTRTVERTWAAVVQPLTAGDFEIPPIRLSVDGRPANTRSMALTVVADLRGEELGLFEIEASSTKLVEGQPFSIQMLVGWDAALTNVNYVNLSLPWWGQLSGLIEMEQPPPAPAASLIDFMLNSNELVKVERISDRTVNGRTFVVFRLVRSYMPTRSGLLEFPTSFFEFGEVEEQRGFFNRERRKVETFFVRADSFDVDVVPLPEAGRPLDFSGAIGSILAEASAEPRDVDVGDSIKFTVEWSGQGNLEFFTPPDPSRNEGFRDFRVYGTTESKAFDRRRVTYDLAPLTSQVTRIPPLPLQVFDPELGQYKTVESNPIEIRVRALENAVSLAPGDEEAHLGADVRDIVAVAKPAPGRNSGPGAVTLGGLLALTPLLWLGVRTSVRRRGDPDAPLERRRRRARRALERGLANAHDAKQQLDAFHEFLAARTKEPEQAWLGRDVRGFRAEHPLGEGLDDAAVESLGTLLDDLNRAAYGGDGGALDRERITRTARELIGGGL